MPGCAQHEGGTSHAEAKTISSMNTPSLCYQESTKSFVASAAPRASDSLSLSRTPTRASECPRLSLS